MSRIFSKTEETGFEDPLGNNFHNYDDFDLVRFVGNDSEIPIENNPSFYNNQYNQHQNTQLYAAVAALQHHLPQNQQQKAAFFLNKQQQQQQQHHTELPQQNRQQQMKTDENFQSAASSNNNQQCLITPNANNHSQMLSLINPQTGIMMHSKDKVNGGIGKKILHGQILPDSPPNTESGNSSVSPSSSGRTNNAGNQTGQHSPYTPPLADLIQSHRQGLHQHLRQQQPQKNYRNGLLPNNAICISQPQQQQQQMLQRPQHRFSMESIPIDQTQTSPQSACGAGYVASTMAWAPPSSQSTPTSHSSSEMSPPSLQFNILNNNNSSNHINLQRQQISDGYLLKQHPQSDNMFSTQMEQLYIDAACDAHQCNCREQMSQQNCNNSATINKQGHGIKRKRANSGNVVDTGGYCNTPNGTAPYNGANHHQHLTGGRLLDCGNNERVGGVAHIVKTETYACVGSSSLACVGSSSLDDSTNSGRTGQLDVDGYSSQSGPASGTSSNIPSGVERLFGTVLENYDGLINSQNVQRPPVSHSQDSFDDIDIDGSCVGTTCSGNKTIRFAPYLQDSWIPIYDIDQRELSPFVVVVADKGFNYSIQDNCFVNQKKNHFQVTVSIAVNPAAAQQPTMCPGPMSQAKSQSDIPTTSPHTPYYISTTNVDTSVELVPIDNFILVFCGAKSETPTSEIQIKQSQADRKPANYEPNPFTLDGLLGSVKTTVPRLHFSETTMNNHRKSGKPNPEQKYFLLVVKLMVNTKDGRTLLVQAFQSERVIVRASNPGQFEQPEAEIAWQKTHTMDGLGCLAFRGPVCIGTAIPEGNAQLTVGGDIICSGNIIRPSDRRVKEDITEISTTEALDRLNQIRIVSYSYKPEIAERWGLSEENRNKVGVIAQELTKVLPEAVRDNGEFLTIDESRVFFETTAAAQELQRLTEVLGCKLSQVEQIAQKVARITQMRKNKAHLTGSTWSGISDFSSWMLGSALLGSKKQLELCKEGVGLDERETKSVCALVSSSLSRTSLTSISPSTDDDDRCNDKKTYRLGSTNTNKSRSACKHAYRCQCQHWDFVQQPWPFDTPRHTNLVVMSLVLVMAFCLIGMFALFFLDFYQKTKDSHPIFSPGQGGMLYPPLINETNSIVFPGDQRYPIQVNDPRGIGEMRELLDNKWTPPWQSPKLQLSAACAASSSSLLLDSLAEMAIPLAAPIPRCPKYCCSSRNYYDAFGQNSLVGDNQAHARLAQKQALKGTESKFVDSLTPLPDQIRSAIENVDDSHIFLSKPLASGVQIFITGHMNVTIDARYCIHRSCDHRNGLHNLYIPISPYIPTIPLHVQFSINDPTQFVDGCGPLEGFNYKECTNSEKINGLHKKKPTLTRLSETLYELSVGSFLQSAYKFRVGRVGVPCRTSDAQRGRTFDEYNLIFYRACSSKPSTNSEFPAKSSSFELIKEKPNASFINL